MARVTVEDCVLLVPNRFELCLIASKRAKNILSGAHSELDEGKEKSTVIALREIGENMIDIEAVKDDIVSTIKNRDSSGNENNEVEAAEDIIESINQQSLAASSNAGASFVSENIEVED